ncbi:MAG TPA: hypothetical protein VGQ76_00775 [Thermoanaerobaculia bacterium]|jgi:hypothetical protein|nr:hypothetical protein [Thermoanaerobaculia bacterium]
MTGALVPLLLLLGSCSSFDPAVLDKLKKLPQLPTLESLLNKPPVTTSFADAHAEVAFLDNTIPENARAFPMTSMPRDPQGRYLLGPGLYELEAQSYCIKAGTYAPSEGDGYLYAPLKGPREKVVRAILRRSAEKPEIEQHDVQVLLWAVIARAKLRDMNPQLQQTATALLDARELFELNGGALGLIPPEMIDKYMARLSPQLQKVFRAEQQLRQHLARANATYQQYEQLAVLAGLAPAADIIRPTPRGRWSWHPDGYFIRYFPQGYQRTKMQVYVPPSMTIERDDEGRIAAVADGRTFRVETSYEGSTITEVRLTAFGKTIKRKPTAVRASARVSSRVSSMETQLSAMTLASDAPFPASNARRIVEAAVWSLVVQQALAAYVKENFPCSVEFVSRLWNLPASALADLLDGLRNEEVTFDASGNVAVPANTSSQRLASGGEPVREPGERWFESLPDCPCRWSDIKFNQPRPDKKGRPGRWMATNGCGLQTYHPDAVKEARWTPTDEGPGQQCTYDKHNKLITGGLAAGTPDFYPPNNQLPAHWLEDVVPFSNRNLFVLFDVPPISCDIYMKLYPPNEGNGCAENIVGPLPSSTMTCYGQTLLAR